MSAGWPAGRPVGPVGWSPVWVEVRGQLNNQIKHNEHQHADQNPVGHLNLAILRLESYGRYGAKSGVEGLKTKLSFLWRKFL